MKSVKKEMRRHNQSYKETERCEREVLHKAAVLNSLGDHLTSLFCLVFVWKKCQLPRCSKKLLILWSIFMTKDMFVMTWKWTDWHDDEFCPILIDFGESKQISKVEGCKRHVSNYIAPEVILGKKRRPGQRYLLIWKNARGCGFR